MAIGQKILFSDLDGTLLNDQKGIEESTEAAISEMLSQGHIFTVCTGRPLASAKAVARQFGLDREGCYIIAYNGGVIYDPVRGHTISYESVPLQAVERMFLEAESCGLYIHTYDRRDDTVLAYRPGPELQAYTGHTKLPSRVIGRDVPAGLPGAPAKMIVISLTDPGLLQQFRQRNAGWAGEWLNSFFSCGQYLEYCPAGVSKGAAVCRLCGYLDIPVEASVAAGDERNDISMLAAAGIGAAPSNAFPAVKEAADHVCQKDHNSGAVGEIIRKFILSGK